MPQQLAHDAGFCAWLSAEMRESVVAEKHSKQFDDLLHSADIELGTDTCSRRVVRREGECVVEAIRTGRNGGLALSPRPCLLLP